MNFPDHDAEPPGIKLRFTATPQTNGDIFLTTERKDLFGSYQRMMHVEILRTKDAAVRQALIAMGWTPPP